MGTYATVDSLRAAAFGIDIPAGEAADTAVARLIEKAEARILAQVPSIPGRVEAGTLAADLVGGVVEDMVLRVVSNPRGIRTVSIDDYQETVDKALSSGALYLTPEEVALLAGNVGGRVGSIKLASPTWWLRG